jgi:hypothetical protein
MNHAHTAHEYFVAYGLFGVAVSILLTILGVLGAREQRKHSAE